MPTATDAADKRLFWELDCVQVRDSGGNGCRCFVYIAMFCYMRVYIYICVCTTTYTQFDNHKQPF